MPPGFFGDRLLGRGDLGVGALELHGRVEESGLGGCGGRVVGGIQEVVGERIRRMVADRAVATSGIRSCTEASREKEDELVF